MGRGGSQDPHPVFTDSPSQFYAFVFQLLGGFREGLEVYSLGKTREEGSIYVTMGEL